MVYGEKIHLYVKSHKDDIIAMLKELVKIPSVRGTAEDNAPFGKECAKALEFTEGLYKKNGFETELDRNGGYLLSYFGEGKKNIGIFAHADVVPAGDDWIYTKPFEPMEKDGCLIGRGSLDDKAAILISLYCAKLLKELSIPFHSRLVMFTGSAEESGMDDIKNYLSAHTPPDFSLVADSAFPIYRGNKGILHFVAESDIPLQEISDFSGGKAFNIILGEASAIYQNKKYVEKGISKHGALPEGSLNAGYLLAEKLTEFPELNKNDKQQMEFVSAILKEYYGEIFGIENDDTDFGKLTVTNGIIKTENGKLSLSFDMRYGASVDIEEAKKKIVDFFCRNQWSVTFTMESKPFIIAEDHPFAAACLDTYRKFTGDQNAVSLVNAGGTYARFLPCAIEIGTTLSWDRTFDLPEGHGAVHQPDEYINVDGLLQAIEATTLMVIATDNIV